jgi:hypothetical protein
MVLLIVLSLYFPNCFFFVPLFQITCAVFAKWGPRWFVPTGITAEASHWFYRNYFASTSGGIKRNREDGLPIEMLHRWTALLPWNVEAVLQQHRFSRLRAMACMHLWTGLLFSLMLRACSPLLFLVVSNHDDVRSLFFQKIVLLPVSYCLSLSVGKLLLPRKRWHMMFAKYKGISVRPSSLSSMPGKRGGASSISKIGNDDGGSAGDVDEDVTMEESTESSGGESTYSGEVVSGGSSSGNGGGGGGGGSHDGSPLRTPEKYKGNHHLNQLQVSPSSGGRSDASDYAVKNDDPESEDQASASESESLQRLLPASSPLLKRMKQIDGTNIHERLNPGTPRGAGARRRVGSYYS